MNAVALVLVPTFIVPIVIGIFLERPPAGQTGWLRACVTGGALGIVGGLVGSAVVGFFWLVERAILWGLTP